MPSVSQYVSPFDIVKKYLCSKLYWCPNIYSFLSCSRLYSHTRTRFSSFTQYPYRTFETKPVYVTPPSSHFKSFPFLLPFPYPCSKTNRTLQYPLIALFAPWYRNVSGYGVRTVLRSLVYTQVLF